MQERLTQSTALVVPTRASVSQISRTWTDRNGNYVVDGDPLNPATNGELGPSPNANFGKQVTNFRLDPDWANGFGARPYNWEFMGALQTELASNISLQAGYYRRVFGNFIVTDNLLTSPADYDPFCITVPTDARLPGGGGGQMCGLYDLNPSKVGLVDTIQTSSSNYGKQTEHYNGVDVTINGRLRSGGMIQGGFNMGRTMTDTCDVIGKLDNPSLMPQPTNAAGGPAPLMLDPQCHKEGDWLPQAKLLGSHPLPWGFRVSGDLPDAGARSDHQRHEQPGVRRQLRRDQRGGRAVAWPPSLRCGQRDGEPARCRGAVRQADAPGGPAVHPHVPRWGGAACRRTSISITCSTPTSWRPATATTAPMAQPGSGPAQFFRRGC